MPGQSFSSTTTQQWVAFPAPSPGPLPTDAIQPEEKEQGNGANPHNEDSLGSLPQSPAYESLFRGKSYLYRNVYKSVLRNMYSYFKNNKDEIIRILKDSGFSEADIEHAFFKITYYNDNERKKGSRKMSQKIVKKILTKRSVYLYILRETLNAMLRNEQDGKLGRVVKRNYEAYTEVCKACYEETVRILGQPAQSRTYRL